MTDQPVSPSSNRLLRRVAEAFVFRGFGYFLLFLMHVVIGRSLGPAGYGIFNFGFMLASLLVIFASLGWPTATLRLFSEYRAKREWDLLTGASKRAVQVVLITSLVFSFLLALAAQYGPFSIEQTTGMRFAALLIPVLSMIGLVRKGLMAFDRANASIALEDILIPLLVLAAILGLGLTGVVEISISYLASAMAVLVGSLVVFRRVFAQHVPAVPARFRSGYWFGIATAMVLGGLAQIIINRIDVLMLGLMVQMDAVGVYVASNRLAMVSVMALIAVNTVMAPRMGRAYHGGDTALFRRTLLQGTLWSALGAVPIVIILFAVPGMLLEWFGDGFSTGENLLRVLTIGQFANALTGPAAFALLVCDRERQFAMTMGVMASVNVVGNLVAIPTYGALGAAVVSAVCVAILNVWQYRLALAIR